MRTKLIESNKPEKYIHSVRNADTVSIPAGTPLVLNLSATPQPPTYTNGLAPGWEDGLQVVMPSTAGAQNANLFYYGVAVNAIAPGQYGEALVFGVYQGLIVRQTRAGTTVSWSVTPAVTVSGYALAVDPVNNAFDIGTGTALGVPVLLDNLASSPGSATNATDTRLAITQLARIFVREM
jgi:hypothetical protein